MLQVTAEQRNHAKQLTYGILYGMVGLQHLMCVYTCGGGLCERLWQPA